MIVNVMKTHPSGSLVARSLTARYGPNKTSLATIPITGRVRPRCDVLSNRVHLRTAAPYGRAYITIQSPSSVPWSLSRIESPNWLSVRPVEVQGIGSGMIFVVASEPNVRDVADAKGEVRFHLEGEGCREVAIVAVTAEVK